MMWRFSSFQQKVGQQEVPKMIDPGVGLEPVTGLGLLLLHVQLAPLPPVPAQVCQLVNEEAVPGPTVMRADAPEFLPPLLPRGCFL